LAFWPSATPDRGGAREAVVTTGLAPEFGDAVAAAAQALAAKSPGAQGRLELDVAQDPEPLDLEDLRRPLVSIGTEGALVTRDDGTTGVVLPGEVVQRGLFRSGKEPTLDRRPLEALLAARAGVGAGELAAMRQYRFKAEVAVEAADRSHALPVVRGWASGAGEVDPQRLVGAVKRGADYLARVVGAQGRFVYAYHPVDERSDSAYGWLRHAGSTYALLEAYEELRTSAYREAAERALGALKRKLTDDPSCQGKYVLDTLDEEEQRVGGAGLSLIAFARYAAVTGDLAEIETMRALARSIMTQQYADGHFRSNADLEADTGQKRKREPIYYTGEAVLGLLRLYALDPQPSVLDSAKRAARWVIRVRDAHLSDEAQEHDHWMAYALNELFRVAPDDSLVAHAEKIARAISKKEYSEARAPAPDWAGGFYEGQSTPAATRLEAYDSVMSLARFAGHSDQWLVPLASRTAAFVASQQFDPDNSYWVRDPARAEGGVRESPFVADVRIDYVQHAISGWLHLARLLRDPAYGKTGVPSQDPVRHAAPPGEP